MTQKNFVVLEGIDGAGTSTQVQRIAAKNSEGKFFLTSEPTKGPVGAFLRQVLRGDFELSPEAVAHLFAADRAEHVYGTDGIIAQAEAGKAVVSDRYLFSSLAYQGSSIGTELPEFVNSRFPLPQLLFFFDIEPEVSLKRIQSRQVTEIYERLDFLKKVTEGYRRIMDLYENTELGEGMKIVRIDATLAPDEIEKIIWLELSNFPKI